MAVMWWYARFTVSCSTYENAANVLPTTDTPHQYYVNLSCT